MILRDIKVAILEEKHTGRPTETVPLETVKRHFFIRLCGWSSIMEMGIPTLTLQSSNLGVPDSPKGCNADDM